MRKIVLAGGIGSRLWPLTAAVNKHLLPIGKVALIEYPLNTLSTLGRGKVNIVTGNERLRSVESYLRNVHPELEIKFHYQENPEGTAQAVSLVDKDIEPGEKVAVISGDNVFTEDFSQEAWEFEESNLGMMLFLYQVKNPRRYGVAEVDGSRIVGVEEKPENPKSNLAITGLAFYDETVFERISRVELSPRGEYEITDVIKEYVDEGKAGYRVVKGLWNDAGTHDSWIRTQQHIRDIGLDEKIYQNLVLNKKPLFK